jgi:hypothetical protein
VPEELGLALGDALGVAVAEGVGGSLADGETMGVGVGVGFVAEDVAHPASRAAMTMVAQTRTTETAIDVSTEKAPGVVHA